MEFGPSHKRAIERLANVQFDGDEQAAFEAIFETGVEHTPIPNNPSPAVPTEAWDGLQYTERQNKTNPCLPGYRDQVYHHNLHATTTRPTDSNETRTEQLLADIALVCQYDAVTADRLAFSIADHAGNWFGWGLDTLGTALQQVGTRYDKVGRTPDEYEEVEVLVTVADGLLHLRSINECRTDTAELYRLCYYTSGIPLGHRPTFEAIATQFDRRLSQSNRDIPRFAFAEAISVEPIEYLTGDDDEWVTRLRIECPTQHLPEVGSEDTSSGYPRECILWLTDHLPVEEVHDHRYQINRLSGFQLGSGTWQLELKGTWYELQ